MATEAQLRATAKYLKEKTTRYMLTLNKETEADIIDWLNAQPSKAQAIKEALRNEMKGRK